MRKFLMVLFMSGCGSSYIGQNAPKRMHVFEPKLITASVQNNKNIVDGLVVHVFRPVATQP